MCRLMLINVENNGIKINNMRLQPLITWLHFLNFITIAILSIIFLKIYKGVLFLYEWLFPFKHNIQNPIILVIGPKNNLVQEIVLQLSQKFNSRMVDFKDINDNSSKISVTESNPKQSQLIFSHEPVSTREGIIELSKYIQKTYGFVDILVTAQNEEAVEKNSTNSFLLQLNKQLLAQFWTAMAFLPGMLRRNSGHIISIALSKRSSLTNTGIIKTIHEELLQSDTKVKLTLVERNNLLEDYLPSLSNDILASLIIRSIWGCETVVKVPSLPLYFFMLPILLLRMLMEPVAKILNFTRTIGRT